MSEKRYLRAFYYGDSGVGKTYFVGTFQLDPRSGPMIYLHAEGQKVTLDLLPERPYIVELDKLSDMNFPYNWLLQGQPLGKGGPLCTEYLAEWGERHEVENPKFKTVAIDSVTYVQRLSQDKIVGNTSTLPGDIPKAAQRQHWGKIFAQLVNMTQLFKRLPMHLILTTICKRATIQEFGMATAYPFIWGQGGAEIPSLMEMSGMLVAPDELNIQQQKALESQGVKDAFNVMLIKRAAGRVTKWQGVRNPPPVMVGPTATKVLDVFYEGREESAP